MTTPLHKFAALALMAGILHAPMNQANAASLDLATGANVLVTDPAGSGRSSGLVFRGGRSNITFSNGAFDGQDSDTLGGIVDVLNAVSVGVGGLGSAVASETRATLYDTSVRVGVALSGMKVGSVKLGDTTGQIHAIQTSGGFSLAAVAKPSISWGGEARVQNLRFDLENRQIVADLSGTSAATKFSSAQNFSLPSTPLWTFADVTGPTAFSPTSWLAANPAEALALDGYSVTRTPATATEPGSFEAVGTYNFSGLAITPQGAAFLVNSLGLLSIGKAALASVIDYGTMTTTLNFAQPIPEPQTFALMGLGLCLMVAAAHRHRPRAS
jgi:hypothetical protein